MTRNKLVRRLCKGHEMQIDDAVIKAIGAVGLAPIKHQEIVAWVHDYLREEGLGSAYEFYIWVQSSTQRLKRAKRIELVKGRGGGWQAVAP